MAAQRKNRVAILIGSAFFILLSSLAFADYSHTQKRIDERENSGQTSPFNSFSKKKSHEDKYEKNSFDKRDIHSDDAHEMGAEKLSHGETSCNSTGEGSYNPAGNPAGPNK